MAKPTATVAVFCASADGFNPIYRQQAEELGRALAAGNIALVYGGARVGLMQAVADAALAAGIRRVKGVKQLGCRANNWLNQDQARLLLEKANGQGLRHAWDVAR